jgi:hypothetical protein
VLLFSALHFQIYRQAQTKRLGKQGPSAGKGWKERPNVLASFAKAATHFLPIVASKLLRQCESSHWAAKTFAKASYRKFGASRVGGIAFGQGEHIEVLSIELRKTLIN